MTVALPGLGPEGGRVALLVAHPGHELRLHAWLCRARPTVYVLTDGSGHGQPSRLPSTKHLLHEASAIPGNVFGRVRDVELYQAILDGRDDWFFTLAEDLASDFRAGQITHLISDAPEGYNPSHDLCRVVADLAALLCRHEGVALRRYDFPLVGNPDCSQLTPGPVTSLRLTDGEFARKLDAVRAYTELQSEAAAAFSHTGRNSFLLEAVREVDTFLVLGRDHADPPYYQEHGERHVAAGRYRTVLRFREHVLPLVRRLAERGRVEAGAAPLFKPF